MHLVRTLLIEVLLIETQEEIHHFAGWEGGGVKGRKNCEQKFCEQAGVSYYWCVPSPPGANPLVAERAP